MTLSREVDTCEHLPVYVLGPYLILVCLSCCYCPTMLAFWVSPRLPAMYVAVLLLECGPFKGYIKVAT